MRILFIFSALLLSTVLQAQDSTKYYFKEVRWTMYLPAAFRLMDSAETQARSQRGLKAIEESTDLKADPSSLKTLISAKKGMNYFSATVTPYNQRKDGDYRVTNKGVKDILYLTFFDQMPNAKIDTSSDKEMVDGLEFDRFHVSISMDNRVLFHMYMLAKYYKGYDFGITYLYLDETTRKQIEGILRSSRFEK